MKRSQAEAIAAKFVLAQTAAENEASIGGMRMMALMIAPIVAENGAIEPKNFLKMCGIEARRFRGKAQFTEPENMQELLSNALQLERAQEKR